MKLITDRLYNASTNLKWRIIFLTLFLLTILFCSSYAQDTTTENDTFQVLGEEQSFAEDYVGILKEYGKENFNKYARGIELYAEARNKFNGLIELMKHKLSEGDSFENSPDFDNTLKTAVDKRVSFTNYLSKEIIGDSEGTRGGPMAIIGDVAKLIDSLKGVGLAIWQEYRSVNDTRREELLDQLESLKWKSFHEIGGGE